MSEKIKVMLVDDEERFLKTTSIMLEKSGFEVTARKNAREAIEEFKSSSFDVVVLDVKMPGMSGHEALAEIKKVRPEQPVIMLTGHGTAESAMAGLRDGVFDYLSKPAPIELLTRKIREAHERKRGVRDLEPKVRDIMVPLTSFSSIDEHKTVGQAIDVILESFSRSVSNESMHEIVHRSILVLDVRKRVAGIITFTDLLAGLQPPYMRLLTERPQLVHDLQLTAPHYSGVFTIMARDLAKKTVREIMSKAPLEIAGDANLMEAASRFLNMGVRRLLVKEGDDIAGVIREQDLFFEISHVMRQVKA